MSDKRKAELQRRLAMGAPPPPPAGLADRIKADIPKYVQPAQPAEPEQTPERWIWKSAAAMRIAASIILLITTGLITWRVVQPEVHPPVASRPQGRLVPAITRTLTRPHDEKSVGVVPAPPPAAKASSPIEEPIEQPTDFPSVAAESSVAAAPAQRNETQQPRDTQVADAARDSASQGIMESITVVASAPVVPRSSQSASFETAPSAAPAPPPPPPPSVAPRAQVGATATLQADRQAMEKAAPEHVPAFFGISTDPGAFERTRAAIARGEAPPKNVDVEAIVNHFASPTSSTDRTYVQTTELSSAPLDQDRALLRVSVDTSPGAPALRNARLSVAFDRDSVIDARRVGERGSLEVMTAVPEASSVTVLYELTLKPSLDPGAIIARVSIEGPSEESSATVTAAALRPWADASRRHRRATLAGVWAESVTSRPDDLKKISSLARALAKEAPSDLQAKELARAAAESAAVLP